MKYKILNHSYSRLNTCCSVAGQQQLCKIFWYNSFIVAHTIQGQQKLAKKSTQFIIMVSSLILLSLAWHLIKDFIFEAKKLHLQQPPRWFTPKICLVMTTGFWSLCLLCLKYGLHFPTIFRINIWNKFLLKLIKIN